MRTHSQFLALIATLCAAQASMADNFSTTVTLDGVTRTLNFQNFQAAENALIHPGQYKGLFPGITNTQGLSAVFNYQGVPVSIQKGGGTSGLPVNQVAIAVQGSPTQIVSVPTTAANGQALTPVAINKAIDKAIKTTIFSKGGAINKELAKIGSASPIAGNPASIMGLMVENAYLLGQADDWDNTSGQTDKLANRFDGGARYGHYDLAGTPVDTITMPLTYTFNMNPRQQLIFSVPFTYINTQTAASYDAGFNIAYKFRVNDRWVLTPGVAYGIRGSFDLADIGHVASGTVTSKYTFDLGTKEPNGLKLSIGNMVGYYTTLPFSLSGYSLDPNLQNYILKNGLSVSKDLDGNVMGHKMNVAANFTDTEYFGSPLYLSQYNELGATVKAYNGKSALSALSVSANYLFSALGNNVNGYRFSLMYQF